jgi:bifunctional DNase/RNase
MIEVELNKIRVDETRDEQVIVFKEKRGERLFPVVIGISEVNSIKLKLSGMIPPRPLTHDLLQDILEKLDATVVKVCIDKIIDNTFFAKIHLKNVQGDKIVIDARPSDSVALALRVKAPIYTTEDVIGQVSAS